MILIKKNEMFLLGVIVKRNFASKYKESYLGILWTVLNPLLMMALFTIMFSTLFRKSIGNFALYFFCGWCVFMFFNNAVSASMNSLKGNKTILQRTPAPKHIFILGSILSEFLNFLIMLVLLVVIMVITHAPFYWSTFPLVFIPIFSLVLMLIGLGFMLSIVCVYYTDVQHLWMSVSLMLMYASGIFYPIDIIPEPFHSILILSPIYWIIDQFRCLVYLGMIPQGIYMFNSVLVSLIIFVFGFIIFKKYKNEVSMLF